MGTFTKKKSDIESDIQQPSIDGNGNTDLLSDGTALDAFDRGFLDYATSTGKNLIPSAIHFGGTIWNMVAHPVQTAQNIGQLGSSVISLVRDGEQGNEQLARDVGQFFADRYGGFENVAQTLRDDPVGFLADASMILTGGATLSARVPTVLAGAVAKNINKVAKAIDPINVGVKVTANTLKSGGGALVNILGNTTGVGSKAITISYLSGKSGGSNMAHLTEHMRKSNVIDKTLTKAQELIKSMSDEASTIFVKGKDGLNLANKYIDPNEINKILMKFKDKHTYNGALQLSKEAQAKLKRVEELIADFNKNKGLHNAKGVDWLKKQIDNEYPTGVGNVGDSGVVISEFRSAIKDVVVKAVPEYQTVMFNYETAINTVRSLEKELALGNNIAVRTTLNKLNQAIKNNSASQFGNQANKLNLLDDTGELTAMLAGDALNSWNPRGVSSSIAPYGSGGLGLMTMQNTGSLGAGLLTSGAVMAGASPRLIGELALGAGKANRLLSPLVTPTIKSIVAGGLAGEYSNPNPYNMGTFTQKRDKEDEGLIINIDPTKDELKEMGLINQ